MKKRLLAGLMAFLMFATLLPVSAIADLNPEGATLSIEGQATTITGFSFDSAKKFKYGDHVSFTVNVGTGPYFYYLKDTEVEDPTTLSGADWHAFEVGEDGKIDLYLAPGNYYLGFSSTIDAVLTDFVDGSFGITIEKATLAAPANLAWTNGTVASWDKVTKTVTGGTVPASEVDHYVVSFYKNDVFVKSVDVTDATAGYDFASDMTTEGLYAFTVKAIPTAGESSQIYFESAETNKKANRVVKVTINYDRGIASASPTAPFIAIVGLNNEDAYEISITPETGRTFNSWYCGQTGVSFADSTSKTTTIRFDKNYTGPTEITIYASTYDDVLPEIIEFGIADGDLGLDNLHVIFRDLDEGVEGYYIGSISNPDDVTTWTAVTEKAGVSTEFDYQLTQGGVYYLHVKDKAGNIQSSAPWYVTQIRYQDFCLGGSVYDTTEYFISAAEDDTFTPKTPSRVGFTFLGFEDYSEGTELEHDITNGYDFAANWQRKDIDVTSDPADVSFTYDGVDHYLGITISNTEGTIAYQWYKYGLAIEGATESSYKIKNVADSGAYKVVVTLTVEGVADTYTSEEITVTISRATLNVSADAKTLTYKDAVVEWTYQITGFVGGETKANITLGTIACDYDPADPENCGVGTYAITVSDFAADNYLFNYYPNELTVNPYDVEQTGSTVVVTLEKNITPYTGSDIEMPFTVMDGEVELGSDDFDFEYTANKLVGEATLTLTFKGNYSGTIVKTFTIEKAQYSSEVDFDGWTFGDAHSAPTVSENPEDGEVTYYYRAKGQERADATTTQPVNAGDYVIYAVIATTDNYVEYTTIDVEFTIAKKVITITSDDGTWEYDGFEHSAPTYVVDGEFVGSDSLRAVTITTAITTVGTAENVIDSYTLSSSTLADNYEIVLVYGTLEITAKQLTPPYNMEWHTQGGIARWVNVSKDGLTVSYEIKLYRVDGSTYTLIDTVTTSGNSYDFSETIRSDCETQSAACSYAFTIKTIPVGGVNKDNYVESEVSDYSAEIHTVQIVMASVQGLKSGLVNGGGIAYIIAGETMSITVSSLTGWYLSYPVWSISNSVVKIADTTVSSTTISVSNTLSASVQNVVLTPNIKNSSPSVSNVEASTTDGTSVLLSFNLYDSLGVIGWMVTTSYIDPDYDDPNWILVEEPAKNIDETFTVTEGGTYYVYVKDEHGNVSGTYDGVKIYTLSFSAGTGGTGTMTALLKIENQELSIPANTFTNAGKKFKNWTGTTGTYEEGGKYNANEDDTLVAQWSTATYNYTVNYFYMGLDGTFSDTPDKSVSFTAKYGQVFATTDTALDQTKEGFTLDNSEGHTSSITIDDDGKVLNIYYTRNQYKITYKYRMPGATTDTVIEQTYYYDATITPEAKPTAATGYGFIGWNCTETGSLPAKMPASNLNASGTFGVYETKYIVNYYIENLEEGTGYTKLTDLTDQFPAFHSRTITYNAADAPVHDGFTASYVTATIGTAGGLTPASTESSASGKVDADSSKTLNFNVYYTRNSYNLTLNVWQGSRDLSSGLMYTYTWSVRYQTPIVADTYAKYNESSWPHGTDYKLADYSDWSTGLGAPATMPAGDVSVSRDFVSTVISSYEVEVYLENVTKGSYSLVTTMLFYANVGAKVNISGTDLTTVNYNNFGSAISNFNRYSYDSTNANNVTEVLVTDVAYGEESAVLKVYFKRNTYSMIIYYSYNDGTDELNHKIASVTKSARWGETFTIEPIAFFDANSVVPSEWGDKYSIIDEDMAIGYDFRNNRYLVSIGGYAGGGGGYSRLSTAADLEATYQYTMPAGNSEATVSYNAIDLDQEYYITVWMRTNNLVMCKGDPDQNLTINVGGTDYKVRVANKATIFSRTLTNTTDEKYDNYPAAQYAFGEVEYGDLNPGYTAVTVSGVEMYIKGEYIYYADESNQFFHGNAVGFSYADKPGYSQVTDFLADYKATATEDTNAAGVYINNANASGRMYGNFNLIITFAYISPYTIYFSVGGVTCNGHTYARGSYITSPNCTHSLFVENVGFSLQWYFDTGYTKPAKNFTLNGNTVLYGRYEKNTVTNHEYVYYQLPQNVTVGGVEKDYLTEADLTDTEVKKHLTSGTSSGVTGYYYDGVLFMFAKEVKSLTFTTLSIDAASYLLTGFHYDDTQTGNMLISCCQAEGLDLRCYFARDVFTLTFNPNNGSLKEETITTYRYGQTVELPEPEKKGYVLTGYTFKIWDATLKSGMGDYTLWTGSDVPTSNTFTMPLYTLYVQAEFEVAPYTQLIKHMYEDKTGAYESDALTKAMNGTGIDITANIEDTEYEAKLYSNGVVTIVASEITFYFNAYTLKDDIYYLSEADLIAATQEVSFTSEQNVPVSSYVNELYVSNFTFEKVIYGSSNSVRLINQTYKATYGMNLAYYYTRNSYAVDYSVVVTDAGADGGTTLFGAQSYKYGLQATVRVKVPNGYSFIGWYEAEDMASGYDDEAIALSTDETYTFVVKAATELCAVVMPDPITITIPEIIGHAGSGSGSGSGLSLQYDYSDGADNVLTVIVTLPENDDDYSFIKGYQWYTVEGETATKIEDATASSYRIPTGKVVDEYIYRCEVIMGHSLNNRTASAMSGNFVLEVTKKPIYVSTTSYTGNYDNKQHTFSIYPFSDSTATYDVYFSETKLDETNYTSGSSTQPSYKDVLVDGSGKVIGHKVYYCVHATDANHSDAFGSVSVTIKPVTVTLTAGEGRFSKEYDGDKTVPGAATEAGTLKNSLAQKNGYFTLNGLKGDDVDLYKNGVILLDFDAAFNSKDVDFANALTLSNMKMILDTGETNNNYVFATNYTFNISAYINPHELTSEWGAEKSFEYDSKSHAPTISITQDALSTSEGVSIEVTGSRTEVGSYLASTKFSVSASVEGARPSNYSVAVSNMAFTITPHLVTIQPNTETLTYDGAKHTLNTFTITSGSIIEGSTYTVSPDNSYKNAGTYAIKPTGMKIYNEKNIDVTDSYTITYVSADLVINPLAITMEGIEVKGKTYDATTDATLIFTNAKLNGVLAGDTVNFVGAKITSSFPNANAGDHTLNISYETDCLSGASAGNYVIDAVNTQLTADGTISKKTLSVKANDYTTVYGTTDISLSHVISGFVTGEDDSLVSGTVSYVLRKTSTTNAWASYAGTFAKGTYDIKVDVSGLSADNYTLECTEYGKLTINKRPVYLSLPEDVLYTKQYDGTTTASLSGIPVTFTAVTDVTESGIVNSDTVLLSNYTATLDSKDSGARTVTVTNCVLSNDNYVLSNETITFDGEVSKIPVTFEIDNKKITYGSAAPTFTLTYKGFIKGEDKSVVTGTITYDTTYDATDAAKRGVGFYDITETNTFSATNYDITISEGKLEVLPATLTITAENKSRVYRADEVTATYTVSGYKFDDTSAAYSGEPTLTINATNSSVKGTYSIVPTVGTLSASNYTFAYSNGTLTITPAVIKISGVAFKSKVYDNSTSVATTQYDLSGVIYDGLLSQDEGSEGITLTGVSYDSKGAGDSKTISFTINMNSYLAARYTLDTDSQKTATGVITKRQLVVSLGSTTMTYGGTMPDFMKWNHQTYSNIATGETLADTGWTATTLEVGYDVIWNSTIGKYGVAIPEADWTFDIGPNYTYTIVDGYVEVVQDKFVANTPSWVETNSGKVTWTATSGICDVAVGHYAVKLKKGATVVYETTTNDTNIDLTSQIYANGTGNYTVSIQVIADTDNNTSPVNVLDSDPKTTSSKNAAKVTFVFANDATTTAGKGSSITINEESSYVMFAGESDIAISAAFKNATGYYLDKVTSSSAALTFTGSVSDGVYSGTVALNASNTATSDITLTIALKAKAPTLNFTLDGDPATAQFSYLEAARPVITATPNPVTGDNITADGYTYTYTWSLKSSAAGSYVPDSTQNTAVYNFPMGQNAYTNYRVHCVVRATRNDNDLYIEKAKDFVVVITKADLTPTLTMEGWTYGETRKAPNVEGNLGGGAITYYYSDANDDSKPWTTSVPTEGGTHYVKMVIGKSTNYSEYTMTSSMATKFVISKAKLDAPQNVSMNQKTGIVTWDSVDGIKENAGVGSKSEVKVSYLVTLTKDGNPYKTYPVTTLYKDVSVDIDDVAVYRVYVNAVSSIPNDCLDSDLSYNVTGTEISATIFAKDNTKNYEGNVFEKVYDNDPIVLEAKGAPDGSTYVWYHDGALVSGATAASLNVKDVADSGTYVVEITHGDVSYSTFCSVGISKRALTVTANEHELTYGDAFSDNDVSYSGFATGEDKTVLGGTLAFDTDYTQFAKVGSYTITPKGYTSDNYTITFVKNTLTINKKNISVTADSNQSKIYGTSDPTFTYTVDGLVNGDKLSGVLQRVAGETVGTYTINQGTLANSNYNINSYTSADFEIKNATITNVDLKLNTLTYNGVDQNPIKSLTATTVNSQTYTVTYCDTADGTYASSIAVKDADTYTLYYKITAPNHNDYTGSFDVTVNKKKLVITAKDVTLTYGDEVKNNGVEYKGFENGETESVLGGSVSYAYGYVRYKDCADTLITPSGLTSDNYDIEFKTGTLHVNKADLADVSVSQNGQLIYNSADQSANVTTAATAINDNNVVFTYCKSENGTYTTTVPGFKDAGTYTVYYKATADYHEVYKGSFTVTIDKKGLTITAEAKTLKYGDAQANAGVKYEGFEGTEDKNVLSGTLSYAYDYEQFDDIGTYTITPSGLTSDNYDITFKTGVLTIEAKPITVSADAKNKVYGKSDETLTYKVVGLVNGDTLSGALVRETGETVGDYEIQQNTLGVSDTNYAITYTPANYTIKNADLTNVGVEQTGSLTYDATAQTATVSTKATAVNDQAVTFTYCDSLTGTFTTTVPTFTTAGDHTVYYKADAANHNTYSGSFTVKIGQKDLTVTANANSIVYGSVPAHNGVAYGEFATGEDESFLGGSLSYAYTYAQYGNVGSYKITPSGLTSSNYNLIFVDGTLTVTVKTVKVTVTADQNKIYGDDDPTFTYTPDGLVNGDTLSGKLTRVAGENVGTYAIQVGTLANSNYTIDYVGNNFEVKNADMKAVSVSQYNTVAYDGTSKRPSLSVFVKRVNGVDYDMAYSESAAGPYSEEFPEKINSGDYTVYYKLSAPNHNDYYGSFTWNLGKTLLKICANSKTIVFGQKPKDNGFYYTGLIEGDVFDEQVSGTITYTFNYNQYDDVGIYTITPGGLTSENYTISFKNGLLSVIEEHINYVNVFQVGTLTYNGQNQTPDVKAEAGTVNSTKPTFTYSLTEDGEYGDKPSFKDAGTYKVYCKASAKNHLDRTTYFYVTIGKAELTVKANDDTITYGDTFTGNGVTITGYQNAETVSVLGGTLKLDFEYEQFDDVDTYTITPSGYTSGNYSFKYETGTLTVQKKGITVTADAKSKTYGDADPALTYKVVGLVNGDTLAGALTRVVGENVNTYDIEQGTLGNTNTNYSITYTGAKLTINNADIVINGKSATTLTYNEKAQQSVIAINATTINNETFTVTYCATEDGTYTTSVPAFTNADTYTVYYKVSAPNHNVLPGSIEVKILPRAITVKANDHSITYGDVPSANGSTITGLVDSSTDETALHAALNYQHEYVRYNDIGTYTITPYGISDTNYTITYQTGTLTVNKKDVTITSDAVEKVFGDADPTFTYNVEGLVNDDTLSGVLSRVAGETVGKYKTTIGTLANSNYNLIFVENELTIKNATITGIDIHQNADMTYSGLDQIASLYKAATTINSQPIEYRFALTYDAAVGIAAGSTMPALKDAGTYTIHYEVVAPNHDTVHGTFDVEIFQQDLIITANEHTITYGDDPSNNDLSFVGFVNGETRLDLLDAIQYDYDYEKNDNVGTYTITPSGYTSNNYNITFVPGTLNVINAKITNHEVTQKDELTYNGYEQEIETNTSADVINNQTLTFVYSAEKNGTYTTDYVSLLHGGVTTLYYKVSAPNHDEESGSFISTIQKAPMTVTANDNTIIYGNEAEFNGVVIEGFLGTDDVDSLGGELVFSTDYAIGKGVGVYTITPSGYSSTDYAFTYETAVLTVDKRDLLVRANAKTITFGDKAQGAGVVFSGFAPGDNRSKLGGGLYYGFGAYKVGSPVGTYTLAPFGYESDNYNITYQNAILKVVKADLDEVDVQQVEELIFNGEEQAPVLEKKGVAVLDKDITYTYALSKTSAYNKDVPTFVEAGEYTVYYKASAANHNDYYGSFMVQIHLAELPDSPRIADFDDIVYVTRGLRIWIYDGVEKVVRTDDYENDEQAKEAWGGVLNVNGFRRDEVLSIELMDTDDKDPAFSLKSIGTYKVVINDNDGLVTDFNGTYWVALLLPEEVRENEKLWVYVNDEFVELIVDGNYGIFKTDAPGEFILYKQRGILNIWWLIITLSVLNVTEWIITGVNNKKRRKLKKGQKANDKNFYAISFPIAYMIGISLIPLYGIEICIVLALMLIISTICMIVAIKKRKDLEKELKYEKTKETH